jgi:hypothetical protein
MGGYVLHMGEKRNTHRLSTGNHTERDHLEDYKWTCNFMFNLSSCSWYETYLINIRKDKILLIPHYQLTGRLTQNIKTLATQIS